MKISKIYVKNNNTQYSIYIGTGALNILRKQIKKLCPKTKKIALILDKNIPSKFKSEIKKQLKNYKVFAYEYLPNENLKSFNKANNLLEKLLKNNLGRNDTIITAGGGIIGDFGSFVASIFKRGLNLINLPSTLLAQVDSSIGGKTAVNSNKGKNLIGTFYQPKLVISDLRLLKSLSKRNIICGFAEILKHAIINDSKFFEILEKNLNKILGKFDENIMKNIIYRSCKIKLFYVNRDENEKNERMILNFGHTFAHAIEAINKYSRKVNHGEAVLVGIILASRISLLKCVCTNYTFNKIEKIYLTNKSLRKFNNFLTRKNLDKLVNFMEVDKKNFDKKINLILLKKIGKTTIPGQHRFYPNEMKNLLKKIS